MALRSLRTSIRVSFGHYGSSSGGGSRPTDAGPLAQASLRRWAVGLKYEQAHCRIIMMMHVKIFILPVSCAMKLQIETEVNGYVMYFCSNLQLHCTTSRQNKNVRVHVYVSRPNHD